MLAASGTWPGAISFVLLMRCFAAIAAAAERLPSHWMTSLERRILSSAILGKFITLHKSGPYGTAMWNIAGPAWKILLRNPTYPIQLNLHTAAHVDIAIGQINLCQMCARTTYTCAVLRARISQMNNNSNKISSIEQLIPNCGHDTQEFNAQRFLLASKRIKESKPKVAILENVFSSFQTPEFIKVKLKNGEHVAYQAGHVGSRLQSRYHMPMSVNMWLYQYLPLCLYAAYLALCMYTHICIYIYIYITRVPGCVSFNKHFVGANQFRL